MASEPHTEKLKVLIVDDEPDFRALLRVLIESHGPFQVVGEAGDGQKALELVAQLRPDAVTMDLQMPVMSGVEAMDYLEERFPSLRVVAVTGALPEGFGGHHLLKQDVVADPSLLAAALAS